MSVNFLLLLIFKNRVLKAYWKVCANDWEFFTTGSSVWAILLEGRSDVGFSISLLE